MAEKIRMNVPITKDMRDWLKLESDKLGVPMSSLIIMALDSYITQKKACEMIDFAKMNGYVPVNERYVISKGDLI